MSGKNVIHMLANSSHVQMESFIIEEESGKLLVIDGGNKVDAPHLLEKLKEISGQEKPHVDAWIFTHAHDDHMDAFFDLMENQPDSFEFDNIYCCFPSVQYLATGEPNGGARTLGTFNSMLNRFGDRVVTVSVDDVYYFGTAKMEVLYTVDCTIKDDVVNNSSLVFKLTLGSKTAIFLGDLGESGGDKLLAAKPDQLKSDICQMAHHGQDGAKRSLYEAIAPEACLWCAPDWLWDNDRGNGFNSDIFFTVIVRGWMDEIGVKKNYCIKDGDQSIEC